MPFFQRMRYRDSANHVRAAMNGYQPAALPTDAELETTPAVLDNLARGAHAAAVAGDGADGADTGLTMTLPTESLDQATQDLAALGQQFMRTGPKFAHQAPDDDHDDHDGFDDDGFADDGFDDFFGAGGRDRKFTVLPAAAQAAAAPSRPRQGTTFYRARVHSLLDKSAVGRQIKAAQSQLEESSAVRKHAADYEVRMRARARVVRRTVADSSAHSLHRATGAAFVSAMRMLAQGHAYPRGERARARSTARLRWARRSFLCVGKLP